jgi:hypothetical protein
VANADQPLGQNVDEEASQELIRGESHDQWGASERPCHGLIEVIRQLSRIIVSTNRQGQHRHVGQVVFRCQLAETGVAVKNSIFARTA